jgi:SAM-dependent MidA family methyltransferase
VVHVDPATGNESLGSALTDTAVPASLRTWLDRWWPLDARQPGLRAEVGTTRDAAWAEVVDRVTRGIAVAVDYGHTRADRPPLGTLRSYRDGHQVDVRPDGSCDVTAHVAVDAVADRVGGVVRRQRDVLHALGVSGRRPPHALASNDPAAYLRDLQAAGQAAELTDPAGLGDFWWVLGHTPDVTLPAPLRRGGVRG